MTAPGEQRQGRHMNWTGHQVVDVRGSAGAWISLERNEQPALQDVTAALRLGAGARRGLGTVRPGLLAMEVAPAASIDPS